MNSSPLSGVDRAGFAAAFAERLRGAGVTVSMTNVSAFTRALASNPMDHLSRLYWFGRVTLVSRLDDLAVYDKVFTAVFSTQTSSLDPHARRQQRPMSPDSVIAGTTGTDTSPGEEAGLPWATLPALGMSEHDVADGVVQGVPELTATAVARLSDVPFERLDEAQLAQLSRWLERASASWPTRRSRRLAAHQSGRRIALRRTLARARRTGWEPVHLLREEPTQRPRRLVVIADVSESMRAYSSALLTLMRVAVRGTDAEVFAFATTLTRLTIALRHRSVHTAIDNATAVVTDRFGGTRIAGSLRSLLSSRSGEGLRGAVVVIASDGWDSDPAEELAAAMSRLRRRAHRVVWLNPRAASPDFEPRVGAMAAALPYCHEFLPAHNFAALANALVVLADQRRSSRLRLVAASRRT